MFYLNKIATGPAAR